MYRIPTTFAWNEPGVDIDHLLIDTFWNRFWEISLEQYAERGRGAVVIDLGPFGMHVTYATAEDSYMYPPLVEQVSAYDPETECVIMLLGGEDRAKARIYRLRRLALAA